MASDELVVADTSPLLNLALIDRLRETGFWISDDLYETVLEQSNGEY